MIFELDQTKFGDWDRFQLRNIGMAVQRRMAEKFGGDTDRIRDEAIARVSKTLEIRAPDLKSFWLTAFSDFAVVLLLAADLDKWSSAEKHLLKEIMKAKAGLEESRYLKLMQKHARLRWALMRLGSNDRSLTNPQPIL